MRKMNSFFGVLSQSFSHLLHDPLVCCAELEQAYSYSQMRFSNVNLRMGLF